MHFIIDPLPKPRMTQSDKWNNRPVVTSYWTYKDDLVTQANQAGFTLPDCFVAIFYIAMPKSWSKKQRAAMRGKPHQQAPDLDNLQKGLADCLLPDNDTAIWFCISLKIWADTGAIFVHPMTNPEHERFNLFVKIQETEYQEAIK